MALELYLLFNLFTTYLAISYNIRKRLKIYLKEVNTL
jgi:hypothetical protein